MVESTKCLLKRERESERKRVRKSEMCGLDLPYTYIYRESEMRARFGNVRLVSLIDQVDCVCVCLSV